MKISKLFHWLYATLMFLPILMFIPSCLYYSLNKYSTNETTTQINYKYQSNEVNSIDDLLPNNIYTLDYLHLASFNGNEDFTLNILSIETFINECPSSSDEIINDSYNSNDTHLVLHYYSESNGDAFCVIFYTSQNFYHSLYVEELNTNDFILRNFTFFVDENNLTGFKTWFTYWLNDDDTHNLPTYTDYNVIESVDTNVQDTISNKMYLAWEGVWNLPLFQWTKNSFVSAPFTYITGLFGVSATNSLNYVFTYFVSISICWLVFDLIMYVPNLAHKWIDKGAIE